MRGSPPAGQSALTLPVKAVAGEEEILLWDKIKLSAITVEDPWGSWGGMKEEAESLDLSTIRHLWKISRVEKIECGPERVTLWVELLGGASRIELRISQARERRAIDFDARVLWDERSARLKLVISGAGEGAEFDVPGGCVKRGQVGEVPGGRWVRAGNFGFASNSLYNFDLKDGALRATVVRASRYGDDVQTEPDETRWLPAMDAGELKFRFLLLPPDGDLQRLARELEEPPVVQHVPAIMGELPRTGSLMALSPRSLRVLALKPAQDGRGIILRAQETEGKKAAGELTWLGRALELGNVAAHEIATWRIGAAKAKRTDILERTRRSKKNASPLDLLAPDDFG